MNTSPQDFVTVEMRGLKAALVAHAKARRESVSAVVRAAVARELEVDVSRDQVRPLGDAGDGSPATWTKLSIRMKRSEAIHLAAAAKSAGLSRGAYLVGLAKGVPVLVAGGSRSDAIAALLSSCDELSTFSRNVHQLTALLSEGNVQRALEYRAMLNQLATEVREHLKLATATLAELRGRGAGGVSTATGITKRSRPWRKA